jgi:HSP20 family protein
MKIPVPLRLEIHSPIFLRELAYGAFQRTFELPEGVDVAHVEAKSANGMLEVRVPVPQVAIPKMIEVKAA